MNQMTEQISSIVADRLARPCRCVDVDINTSRIAILEQWRDAALSLEASATANSQACTVAGFQTYPQTIAGEQTGF
jgi:D-serine deaminase-like pyridoxal phosphate-dependent protein